MAVKNRAARSDRPHVALLVETSLISGREILRGISRFVREHGPWSIYHEPRSLEASVPGWLKKWHGDGIIARLQTERITAAVLDTRLPAVDVLGVAAGGRVPLVHVDDKAIGRAAAEHLLERGFTHFGWCGFQEVNWSDTRRRTFLDALAAAGHTCQQYAYSPHRHSDSSWEAQQERLARWVAALPKPAGILACYDPVGQKVLEACRRAGVSVPEEAAVLGVDNDETICEVCDPPLSSVAANHHRVGYEAAALLDRLMRGKPVPKAPLYVLPTGVVVRQSTDVLAIGDSDVAAALHYIREHACERVSVRDVIQRVSISQTALKDRFRRLLGRSIHDEILRVRVRRAKELLAQTDMPIRTVALRAGFRHQEYMGVVFRQKVGLTPGQFRKEAQH
jgi:LacI family transcriptional regulator